MNTGLLDAHALAWRLAAVIKGHASESLLDSYEAERSQVAREVLAMSHDLVRLSSLSLPWQRALRGLVVPTVTRVPLVRRRIAERMSQVYVDYRSSPLTAPARGRTLGVRPGDRALDTHGLRCDGVMVRFHQLLRAPGHVLLLVGEQGHHSAALESLGPCLHRWGDAVRVIHVVPGGGGQGVHAGAVIDVSGETSRRYGRWGGVHLIRPDGYLAASGLGSVEAYLRRLVALDGVAASP